MPISLKEAYGEAPETPEVTPKDLFGSRPGTMVSRDSLAGVQLTDLGYNQPTSVEDQADQGFFQRSGGAIKDWYMLSPSHPVSAVTGVVKGLGAGAVSLGELAAKGIAGIANAWFTQTGMQGFEKGSEAVDKWLEADREASKGILLINLAPKDKTEEAFQRFLGILPDGITAAGDTVFEKTGSALAGAGVQTLLTALTMKPSAGAKIFKGPLKLAKGEPLTRAGKAGAEKVQAAFDELAVKDPQGATAIAEHVIEADPELGLHLMKAVEEAGKKDPEQVGREAARVEQPKEFAGDSETVIELEPNAPAQTVGSKYTLKPLTKEVFDKDIAPVKGRDGKPLTYEQYVKEVSKPENQGEVPTHRLYVDTGEGAKPVSVGSKASYDRYFNERSEYITSVNGKATKPPVPNDAIRSAAAKKFPGSVDQVMPMEGLSKATREFAEALDVPVLEADAVTREAMRVKANKDYAEQLKNQEREYTRSQITYEDAGMGEHLVKSPNGQTLAQEGMAVGSKGSTKTLVITETETAPNARGQGEGTLRMEKLVDIAEKNGLKLTSDKTVSAAQQKVYESLKKRGYIVKENENVVNPETGGKISTDYAKPVYEVSRPKPKPWNPKRSKFIPPEAPAYYDAGHPVTRASVTKAFRAASQLGDLPGVRLVTGKLSEYYQQIIRTVNPEALGPEAKTAASILAKRIAEQMQKDSAQVHKAAERLKFWNSRSKGEVIDFIKRFEKGEKFDDPLLNKAAEAYRRWSQEIFETEKRLGIEYEPIDNYLYHVFQDSGKVSEFFSKKYGAKWNNPGFMKERSLDLYAQAVQAGYKPKWTNPEDIMLARQHASNIAEMRVNTLSEMERAGLARNTEKGVPDFPATEWRAPNGERYWVHDSANAVMHNAFNTQSLWNLPGIGGDLFRSAMFLKNTIVPIKLALSLFHPLHVLTIDNATGMVRATKELLSGTQSPPAFVSNMVKATLYTDVISNPRTGYNLLQAYKGKLRNPTAADLQALQFMAEGGFIPEMSSQYKMGSIQKLRTALQQRSAASAWHLPFAAIEAMAYPMFQVWIPSLKIASYLRDVQSAIKVDPSLLDNPLKRQLTFRKLAKSVDNRYGEMAYNTLFWNRWVKDLAVANTLSLGWQMGFIREYGGGMLDVGQLATKKGGLREKIKSGMLDRPLFVTYYTTQALAYGGLMTWAMSGQAPQDLKDYIYPKSSPTPEGGKDERVNTMFYPREFAAIYKHMENEGVVSGLGHLVSSKASGVVGMTKEWATGINSFDQEIRDPNAPLYKQVEQTLASTLDSLEPISIETIHRSKSESKIKARLLAFSGFSPAPKYVTESKTEAMIKATFRKYYAQRLTPYDKAQSSELRGELKEAFQEGDSDRYGEAMDKLIEKFQISAQEQRRLERSVAKGEDPLVDMFKRLTWQQQKQILDRMSPEDREVFLQHSNRQHVRYTYEPPEEKK